MTKHGDGSHVSSSRPSPKKEKKGRIFVFHALALLGETCVEASNTVSYTSLQPYEGVTSTS
ncbi:hypothetical protein [Paracerasibacillus soli]|uniref:Uncharacterized protein n=1 Tax=Paracerasibacillus soli TaxID=480284 RepID=A0ABU5CSI0_9BACI|nr:hypothetical protein [Virgibacillus soli]MDY0409342.1 hypothetical protein [Virgibacillus soli]